jgi:enolase
VKFLTESRQLKASSYFMKIKQIKAREILDSRGNPTIEVEVTLRRGIKAKASVPSGASTGVHEAWELRDGDKNRYGGKGVLQAVKNVNEKIAPMLIGKKANKQRKIDEMMLRLDGMKNKANLGANAILGVSLACARAAAAYKGVPLYKYLRSIYSVKLNDYKLPVPLMNIINGGKHADSKLNFQEFIIVPKGIGRFSEKLRAGAEIFAVLKKVLKDKGFNTNVGDEGGYAPAMTSVEEAVLCILEAIKKAGYNSKGKKQIFLGADIAASEFYDKKSKKYVWNEGEFSSTQMVDFFQSWITKYPFISLEDPLDQDDWSGWQEMTKKIGKKITLIGDDLFVTSTARLQQGLDQKVANAILIKINQIGSLTETLDCIALAKRNGYATAISHRSGETNDDFIADLAVAVNSDFIKTGSLSRGERLAKYNRLTEIEREI